MGTRFIDGLLKCLWLISSIGKEKGKNHYEEINENKDDDEQLKRIVYVKKIIINVIRADSVPPKKPF